MKKLIVLLLCLVMLAVLVGCNESETPSDTDNTENVTTNNNGETETPAETTQAAPDETTQAVPDDTTTIVPDDTTTTIPDDTTTTIPDDTTTTIPDDTTTTIPDDTTPVDNEIIFKTLSVNGNNVTGEVANSVTMFSFLDEIETKGTATYTVSLDIYGRDVVPTKTVALDSGDNTFYVLATLGDDIKLYTVTIRRRPMYTVSFDTDGGTSVTSQQIEEGYLAQTPTATVTRAGYTFSGWDYDFTTPITSNITIHSQWKANTYKITYDANGGSVNNATTNVTFGNTYTLETPTRTGYTFSRWYYSTTPVSTSGTWSIAENTTLKASWTANTNTTYTVKHYIEKADGTYELKETEQLAGKTDSQVTPTTKNYSGFTAPSTQTVTVLPDGSRVVEYYYTFIRSYEITFIDNNGNQYSQTLKYSNSLPNAARSGFTFAGWFTDVGLTQQITTVPAQNITVYAYWAEENKPADFTYSGTESITITNYKAADQTVYIPSYIGGKQVTSIGKSAFSSCTSLTSIEIPDSVTSIGKSAFYKCSSLESITIPFVGATKNGTYDTHFGHVFGASLYSDDLASVPSSLKTVIITGGNSIGSYAFYNCNSLTSIEIPDSVTSIGFSAFIDCSSLTSITIPDSVTSIGDCAFEGCRSLTSITIPDSVTSIGSSAFFGCFGLTRIEIPDSVTSIGWGAFSNCDSLTSIEIPNSVKSIGERAFYYCSSLTSITVDKNSQYYKSIDGNLYNKNGTELLQYAIGKTDTSFTIPNSVTSIGPNAFAYCSRLTSIEIPGSVTSIGEYAFYGCSSLTSIEIPNSVKSIGDYAFAYCSRLTSIEIPNSVKSIGERAFFGCSSLTSIEIPNSVTSIGSQAFDGCSSLTSIEIPNSVKSIGERAFYYCSSLTSINYNGTKAQWNAIEKAYDWNYSTGKYTVYCSDGNITK